MIMARVEGTNDLPFDEIVVCVNPWKGLLLVRSGVQEIQREDVHVRTGCQSITALMSRVIWK